MNYSCSTCVLDDVVVGRRSVTVTLWRVSGILDVIKVSGGAGRRCFMML